MICRTAFPVAVTDAPAIPMQVRVTEVGGTPAAAQAWWMAERSAAPARSVPRRTMLLPPAVAVARIFVSSATAQAVFDPPPSMPRYIAMNNFFVPPELNFEF
jgi:hypothetical protein